MPQQPYCVDPPGQGIDGYYRLLPLRDALVCHNLLADLYDHGT